MITMLSDGHRGYKDVAQWLYTLDNRYRIKYDNYGNGTVYIRY